MASGIAETWKHMNNDDDFKDLELSQIDHNILMSVLLDETPIHDCDHKRLMDVMRSLEAEIDHNDQYEFGNATRGIDLVDCQSSNGESKDENCLISHDDLDLEWTDMEIVPSSANGDMGSWYVDHHVQEMCDADEFGGAIHYSNFWHGNALADQDYGSLWHDMIVTDMNF